MLKNKQGCLGSMGNIEVEPGSGGSGDGGAGEKVKEVGAETRWGTRRNQQPK